MIIGRRGLGQALIAPIGTIAGAAPTVASTATEIVVPNETGVVVDVVMVANNAAAAARPRRIADVGTASREIGGFTRRRIDILTVE